MPNELKVLEIPAGQSDFNSDFNNDFNSVLNETTQSWFQVIIFHHCNRYKILQYAFIFWIKVIIVYETALLTIQAWMLLNNYF